jgi:hypothetical protein
VEVTDGTLTMSPSLDLEQKPVSQRQTSDDAFGNPALAITGGITRSLDYRSHNWRNLPASSKGSLCLWYTLNHQPTKRGDKGRRLPARHQRQRPTFSAAVFIGPWINI